MRETKSKRHHRGHDHMNAMAAQHGIFICPGVAGRVVLFDTATGKELASYWSKSRLLYPVGRPARRVAGLAAAIRLAGELRKAGAA